MGTSSSLLSCYILLNLFFFLLLIEKNSLVLARELVGEHHIIDVNSLLPSSSCSMLDNGTNPSKLKVVHRRGPCASRAHQDKPSHLELLRKDQARVDYIHRRAVTTRRDSVDDSLSTGIQENIDYELIYDDYIVTIGLGTPTKSFSVLFDTGSDLTWTQCVPCNNCYPQNDPLYDPTQSSTFSKISCHSSYCRILDVSYCPSPSSCIYIAKYVDGSQTQGSLVQDALTFSSNTMQNIKFGCGNDNRGLLAKVDGLLGLGRGALSFISQTAQFYGNVFSYCIPSKSNVAGYLSLGSSATGVQYTPMLTNPNMPSHYFLKLVAISIRGERLALSPTVFSSDGALLDSGTMISRLPPTAYSALRSIFRQHMTNYPMAPSSFILDTCYDFTNYQKVNVPAIAFIFDNGVTAKLDFMGILYVVSISKSCLAFAGNNDASDLVIIGNVQQRGFNVVYDVGNLKIGFGANGCS